MAGMLAAAVLALFAGDPPVPSTAPVVRTKPKVRKSVVVRPAVSDDSNSNYASLGLRASTLPSWVPDWLERPAWRVRERFSWIWGLKATIRDSILGGS